VIHVIATITVRPRMREAFLEIFRENVPNVLAEEGCVRYEPCADVETGLPAQGPVREQVVTIVETWESLEHLRAHLGAPHMKAYKEATREMVEGVVLQVVEPV
jgi:quinol monooxygenase YgiN